MNEIDAFLQKILIGNQKCDTVDDNDADGDMIPMCPPCFAGNTKKTRTCIRIILVQCSPFTKLCSESIGMDLVISEDNFTKKL